MATIQELESALINADAAGDAEAAKVLAGEIMRMRQATAKRVGASGSWQDPKTGSWEPDKPSGFKRGFIDDPIAGLKQLGAETEMAALFAPEWANKTRDGIVQQEREYQVARGETGMDWPRLAGQMINPLNLGIAAVTKTPPGASMLQRLLSGAAGGAAMGAASPVYEGDRSTQAITGAVGGAVAAPVTGAIARLVKPNVDPNVAMLREAGVVPTIGQSLGGMAKSIEDKAMSLPIVGDAITSARQSGLDQFQRAAYARALNPIEGNVPVKVGFEGMRSVREQLQKRYNDLLPKIGFAPDQQFQQETAQLRQLLGGLPQSDQAIFDRITQRVMSRGTTQGNMSGETFKNVESSLGDEIARLSKDTSYEKQQLADALKQFRESMRQGLERSNPMYQGELRKINEGWANYAILRRAASGVQAAKNEGTFTPAQLAQGVQESAKRGGQAVGRRNLSEGTALMQDLANAGQQVLPSKYPDSGTAGRLIQGGLLGGAAAGNVPLALETAGAAGAASIPYLPGVRNLTDMMINHPGSDALAEAIRSNPALLSVVAPALLNN